MALNEHTETVRPEAAIEGGLALQKTVTINRDADELYRVWRDFKRLPEFMEHVRAVTTIDERRSHWVVKGPAGTRLEWDAEIVEDRPGEVIGWRSLPGAEVDNAGEVHFRPAPGGRGTEVRVLLRFDPPAQRLGALVARLLGEHPSHQLDEDLRRFKQLVETGRIPTTTGQPSGRRS
jgi:uncharacterized membrane protein